jgi:SAM-dependent methyltransferase
MTAERTAAMRRVWGLADYTGLAPRLDPAAERLAALAAAGPVLDLAAGTGNVAVRVAAAGHAVTAADLSPRMVELGRARTAGTSVEWVEADAAALPFPDGAFGTVLSAFGMIFAPDPAAALAQVRRVLVPDGRLALTAWTAEGWMARMTTAVRRFVPPPAGVADVLDWGRPHVARGWLEAAGFTDVELTAATLPWHFDSPAAMTAFLLEHSPTHVATAAGLGPAAPEMLAAVEATAGEPDRPVRIEAEYLVISARSPGREDAAAGRR